MRGAWGDPKKNGNFDFKIQYEKYIDSLQSRKINVTPHYKICTTQSNGTLYVDFLKKYDLDVSDGKV